MGERKMGEWILSDYCIGNCFGLTPFWLCPPLGSYYSSITTLSFIGITTLELNCFFTISKRFLTPFEQYSVIDFGSIDLISMPIHELWWGMSTACICIHSSNKIGKKRLKKSWFYVICYNFWRCRLGKRSKAASKTGQILLKTPISVSQQYIEEWYTLTY